MPDETTLRRGTIKRCVMRLISFFDRRGMNGENTIVFLAYIGVVILVFASSLIFKFDPMTVVTGIWFWFAILGLSAIVIYAWVKAGIVVFRSLAVIGAELSVLALLSQSYCGVQENMRIADNALMSIIGFGLLYIGFSFLKSLYQELFGDKGSNNEQRKKGAVALMKKNGGGKILTFTLGLYAIFVATFLVQLYEVVNVIFANSCVYIK